MTSRCRHWIRFEQGPCRPGYIDVVGIRRCRVFGAPADQIGSVSGINSLLRTRRAVSRGSSWFIVLRVDFATQRLNSEWIHGFRLGATVDVRLGAATQWSCIIPVPVITWSSAMVLSQVGSISHGHIMVISWSYHGHIMVISWSYHGHIMVIYPYHPHITWLKHHMVRESQHMRGWTPSALIQTWELALRTE